MKKIMTQKQLDEELLRINEEVKRFRMEANKKKKAAISEVKNFRAKKLEYIQKMIIKIVLPKVEKLHDDIFAFNKTNIKKTLEGITLYAPSEKADTEKKELSDADQRKIDFVNNLEKILGNKEVKWNSNFEDYFKKYSYKLSECLKNDII